MKLGVITVLFGDRPLDETLSYLKSLGIEELEVGAGGYPGKAHCDPEALLADDKKLEEFTKNQDTRLRSYQTLGICAGAAVTILFI